MEVRIYWEALGPDEAESKHKKRWRLHVLLVRVPKASQNDTFEALGGQVGQEHVIEAPLDGEGKACSAPSEPKRVPKEDQF